MIRRQPTVCVTYVVLMVFALALTPLLAPGQPGEPLLGGVERLRASDGRDISGHGQSGIVGAWLDREVAIVVTGDDGQPVVGAPVHFVLVRQPAKAKEARVEPSMARTDTDGVAKSRLRLGTKPGSYVLTATTPDMAGRPASIEVDAKGATWLVFLVFALLGGLAIFLYGMGLMSEGMKKAAGDQMRSILGVLTNVRIVGVLVGAFVTVVIQSSSATTVMLVGFVDAQLMSLAQSLGVILGADIGTTITAQLIAFKVTHYALLVVAAGFLVLFLAKSDTYRAVGEALLGFGLVFFGIHVMSEAMYPFRTYRPFIEFLLTLRNPILGILVGAAFTALIQSSSAFTGILIALSQQGLLSLEAGIPLLFGANIGTCVTAALASLGSSREAKRVAVAHTLFKVGGVLLFVWFIGPLATVVRWLSPDVAEGVSGIAANAATVPRQIANTHTLFNVGMAIIFFPFVPAMARLVEWVMPDRVEQEAESADPNVVVPQYLDRGLLTTPVLAIEQARREILRMAEFARGMLMDVMPAFLTNDMETAGEILRRDNRIDSLQRATTLYLTQVAQQDLTLPQSQRVIQLLHVATELEHIGDVIEKDLVSLVMKKAEGQIDFSPEGREELVEYHERIVDSYDNAIEAFQSDDALKAQLVATMKPQLVALERIYRQTHYDRLTEELSQSVESSQIHLDLLDGLRRVNSYSESIATALL
ncbi:Na/Pi symporter [Candidatus Poribacteria bacterium]|jgi:phosphate:Na+ symporter|nr:Na/Pi symporter [Candidatus Poribacteria bacterium]MBT5536283.1 Na/Pi symporter [Candidatus Poribacteria bacterium]MBT7809372.1 Na/Pi symporter [Candidatus Poribacteria bacterium]